MPRDSGGNMTLAKPPFVAGTASSAPDLNSDLDDIKTELTDSLSRSGKGGLLSPLKFLDGALATPAISFTNETGSGFFRNAANDIRLSIAGVARAIWNATGHQWISAVADGASAVAHTFDTTNALANATAKLASWKNGGSEKASMAKDGSISSAGGIIAAGSVATQGGISTGQAAAPFSSGDIMVNRYAAPTTGYLFFGNGLTKFFGFDGTLWQLAGAALVNPATFVVAARVRGSDGAILAQTGSVTAGCSRGGVGQYTVTVSGLTTSAIVLVTNNGNSPVAFVSSMSAGSFAVATETIAGTLQDCDFSFVVAKL